jgi:hypothetical protein
MVPPARLYGNSTRWRTNEGRLDGLPAPIVRRDSEIEIQTHDVDRTLKQLLECGVSLSRMKMRSWNLEDLFIALTGKDLRG